MMLLAGEEGRAQLKKKKKKRGIVIMKKFFVSHSNPSDRKSQLGHHHERHLSPPVGYSIVRTAPRITR